MHLQVGNHVVLIDKADWPKVAPHAYDELVKEHGGPFAQLSFGGSNEP